LLNDLCAFHRNLPLGCVTMLVSYHRLYAGVKSVVYGCRGPPNFLEEDPGYPSPRILW
jgi:hypothetical protein